MSSALPDGQPPPQFTVRPARMQDRAAIADVARLTWNDTYGEIFTPAFIAKFLRRAYAPESLAQPLLAPNHCFLVASAGEVPIGFGHVGPAYARSGAPPPPAPALLQRLYVLPAWQRRGVGSALLTHVETWLVDRRMREYGCFVHARNAPSIAFYSTQGFVHLPDHDYEDEWYMVRVLSR